MTDSNPKTKGSNSTPNNQDKQTQQQNNTTNSYIKEFDISINKCHRQKYN